jgi:hypothetical protein
MRYPFSREQHSRIAAVENDEHIRFGSVEHDLYLGPVDLFKQATACWWGICKLATWQEKSIFTFPIAVAAVADDQQMVFAVFFVDENSSMPLRLLMWSGE